MYGVLEKEGHDACTRAMADVLNSMLGSRVLLVEGGISSYTVVGWENLAVFTGESPSVKVTVRYTVDHAEWKRTVNVDARMLTPDNIPAMEVIWS